MYVDTHSKGNYRLCRDISKLKKWERQIFSNIPLLNSKIKLQWSIGTHEQLLDFFKLELNIAVPQVSKCHSYDDVIWAPTKFELPK